MFLIQYNGCGLRVLLEIAFASYPNPETSKLWSLVGLVLMTDQLTTATRGDLSLSLFGLLGYLSSD